MKKRIKYLGILVAFILAGCSAQRYEDIRVWTPTNTPSLGPNEISIGEPRPPTHTISIQADNARLQDLFRKVAEHENMTLRFDANVGSAFCTVNLLDVEPLPALESIADMHDCVVVKTNNTLIVLNKEKEFRTKPSTRRR